GCFSDTFCKAATFPCLTKSVASFVNHEIHNYRVGY
ncbi:MAG: hypothetical protein ACI9AT_001805, partial [Ulvibacter sp.]